MKKIFTISVDVEGVPLKDGSMDYSTIADGIPRIIDLFKEFNILATFYVTADAAESTSDVMQEVINRGHEIGCHGYEHERLDDVTQKVSEHLDVAPIGFRSHRNRINGSVMDSLIKLGYKYDSSVVPSLKVLNRNYFPTAPQTPYRPSLGDIRKRGELPIVEVPISTLPMLKLPLILSYMMHFGLNLYKLCLMNANPRMLNVVLHPYDLFTSPEKREAPFYFRFMYRRRARGFQVLRDLMLYFEERFSPRFVCTKEVLRYCCIDENGLAQTASVSRKKTTALKNETR